jgi:DnaJ-class molecular chaperone
MASYLGATLRCDACGGRGWVAPASPSSFAERCRRCKGEPVRHIYLGTIARAASCDRRTIKRLDERGSVRASSAARILAALSDLGLLP